MITVAHVHTRALPTGAPVVSSQRAASVALCGPWSDRRETRPLSVASGECLPQYVPDMAHFGGEG
jgi:hypothetical protein